MKSKSLTYKQSGVSYDLLDTFKRLAQKEARNTSTWPPLLSVVEKSRGESSFVWEEKNCYRAFVMEGLGTKNRVADSMRKKHGPSYYDAIAQDTVAMIINDLIVVGATPQVITAYFAVGDSQWFADEGRVRDLVKGWVKACKMAGVTWGGGETPTLQTVIEKDAIDLAGSAVGVIQPKKRLTLGDRLVEGDAIVLVESSGIHSNGITLARALAKRLPKGYETRMPSGKTFGEALLAPTHIYANVVDAWFASGLDVHYMVHITGHGWRKLMRAPKAFSYVIDALPPVPEVFTFMQKQGNISLREMYATYNMGAGFACILPAKHAKKAVELVKKQGLKAWIVGHIEAGKASVTLPGGMVFSADTLKVRG
jgi:phosphoribosylformylglycinamidine cyclo-ligase